MGITPLTFTGVSSLSNDLQTVLTRAVSIAQIPLKQLQSADSDTLQRGTLLTGMNTAATALGNAVASLGTLAGNKSLLASSSDSSKVSVQNTGAGSSAAYTVSDITSVASAASETTLSGFIDASATPVSANGSLQLTIGSKSIPITLTDNTLNGLRDAINGLKAGVTATVISTGTTNYLSVAADASGANTLSLVDDPGVGHANTEMLSASNQGTDAIFKLNGLPVQRATNTVNDAVPGLSITVRQPTASDEKITLSLATDKNQLSNSIYAFVNAFNGMVDTVQAQVGPSAGLLSGDYVVREVQDDLRALSSYASGGAIKSLWEVGVSFDQNGHLAFDTTHFSTLSDSDIQGVISFFGSPTTGFGALSSKLNNLTDPITGSIQIEQDGFAATDKSLQSQMATLTDRVNSLQSDTAARLQAADALLAGLESQEKMLTASIQGMNYAMYGKQTG